MISGERIVAAGVLLPLSQNVLDSERYGTRHRAAIGISEQTDAIIIVVSEETGSISLVLRGRIERNLSEEQLRRRIFNLIRPPGRPAAGAVPAPHARGPLGDRSRGAAPAPPEPDRVLPSSRDTALEDDRGPRRGDDRRAGAARDRRSAALMGRLLRNWHLKLAALALATILYTGFVYSGTFTEQAFEGIPIRDIGQPAATYVSPQQLGTVDIRYRATTTAAVTAETFDVTVDLSAYDMGHSGEPQALPIAVRSLNTNVTVLGFSPTTVSVTIDRVAEKKIPVVVETGTTPAGLIVGNPQVSTDTVTARGPQACSTRSTMLAPSFASTRAAWR